LYESNSYSKLYLILQAEHRVITAIDILWCSVLYKHRLFQNILHHNFDCDYIHIYSVSHGMPIEICTVNFMIADTYLTGFYVMVHHNNGLFKHDLLLVIL
jgi:hypothetical protein